MVFLYHQAPKDTRWLVAFLICPSTNPGSFTTNGVRLTVSLLLWIRFCRKELSLFKGDMIYFNVLGQHFLILSSLKRTTDLFEKRSSNYSDRPRLPMLIELYVSDFFNSNPVKRKFVSEWDGISTSVLCLMAHGGEDTGDHFTIFFTLMRCPNTRLFKYERSMHFYADCLTHPIISSTMFDSKHCAYSER